MTSTPHDGAPSGDPELVDPAHASAERAGETPRQEDAEQMEAALREGGPLREAGDDAPPPPPVEDGPGTSLA